MNTRSNHRALRSEADRAPGRPLGFSAGGYYSFSLAIAVTLFFVLWGVLHDSEDETPWISAGIVASVFFASSVVVREVIIRRRLERLAAAKRSLDRNVKYAVNTQYFDDRTKLTLARHNELVAHISMKSNAAKVLDNIPETHREVFELCDQYLRDVSEELPKVAPGSPRLAAFRTGTRKVQKMHRYHVIRWAEMESRQVAPAAIHGSIDEKLLSAARAADVLNAALSYYPDDRDLIASSSAVNEVLVKARAMDLMRRAEAATEAGDDANAIELYEGALEALDRNDLIEGSDELRSIINERIRVLDPGTRDQQTFGSNHTE